MDREWEGLQILHVAEIASIIVFDLAFHGSISDSLLLLEFVQTTITKNEEELVQMETQIDSDHANDLLKLQELLREESKQDLLRSKDNLIKDLREIGERLYP